jgi:hypothetical protein
VLSFVGGRRIEDKIDDKYDHSPTYLCLVCVLIAFEDTSSSLDYKS